jgi:hypothetical protein
MACSAAKKRGFRSFLIDGSAADYHFAKPGLVTSAASNGGEDHSRRIHLLHVIHKVRDRPFELRPASSTANIPGWPSVGTLVTCVNPAARSISIVN